MTRPNSNLVSVVKRVKIHTIIILTDTVIYFSLTFRRSGEINQLTSSCPSTFLTLSSSEEIQVTLTSARIFWTGSFKQVLQQKKRQTRYIRLGLFRHLEYLDIVRLRFEQCCTNVVIQITCSSMNHMKRNKHNKTHWARKLSKGSHVNWTLMGLNTKPLVHKNIFLLTSNLWTNL